MVCRKLGVNEHPTNIFAHQVNAKVIIKGNQGQYSVSKQPRHTEGPLQLNSIRHSVTKTGTAQHGQAQRNKVRHSVHSHSVTNTSTAQHGQAQRN